MASEKKSSVSDIGAWAMNVISSVGIIMANKQVMSRDGYDFRFATTLTAFHFTLTAMVGFVSNATGYSVAKEVPLWELLWFSIVANTSIVGMNLSLMLNSVGFYQISKLSMIPVVCVMEWILHNKNYTREVKIAVIVVVIGVGVCSDLPAGESGLGPQRESAPRLAKNSKVPRSLGVETGRLLQRE